MKTLKKFAIALVAVASIFTLSSCAAEDETPTFDANQTAQVFNVKLTDGRTIDCIIIKKGIGQSAYGGPSCDWNSK